MARQYKTAHKVYTAWNYQKEIEDLNKASEQGWQLIKGGCFSSKFKWNPDVCYRYQIDYPGKVEDMGRYIETFREQGWEFINATFNGWHYFRKAYITTFQNTVNNVDTLELSTIELYVVDLQGWEVVENINVAKPGLACGNDTLKYGGLDANILNIDNTTLRITFTTQLSDGVHRLCYRDYTVSNGTLGPVGLCRISDATTTHDFNIEGVKAVCGDFSASNPIMNMSTQYATYNGEHYIGLGVDNVYPNIPILKTTDFITFTHWATPTVEGNHAQYESALVVVKQSNGVHLLYTATRQTYKNNPEKMLIMAVSLDDGSVVRSTWIPDQRARPFWYYDESTGSAYLFHILNDQRATSTVTQITVNSFAESSIGSVADMFGMIYPSVVEHDGYMVVAYMRAYRTYIAKLPKLPIYTHNQVIPMINKFLDYFTV